MFVWSKLKSIHIYYKLEILVKSAIISTASPTIYIVKIPTPRLDSGIYFFQCHMRAAVAPITNTINKRNPRKSTFITYIVYH